MRIIVSLAVLCLALSACSGGSAGGGGIGSGGGVAPGSGAGPGVPPPQNAIISDLQASQTFRSQATVTDVALRSVDGVVTTTSSKREGVQVQYDASSKTYTVSLASRTQSFDPNDIQSGTFPGEVRYAKRGAGSDYLTLVTTPYYGAIRANRYAGMGYWQHNDVVAGTQTTQFSTFAYGMTTAADAVPRVGSARWRTDILGLLTEPNVALRSVQGTGSFDVDFGAGLFSAFANLDEFDFVTGGGRSGSLPLQAGGRLTSGSMFEGDLSYASSRGGILGGEITGEFYGPGADEIGAAFRASRNGAVLTGAMTGQRDGSVPVATQTLLNVQAPQQVFTPLANFFTQRRAGEAGFANVMAFVGNRGRITIAPTGPTEIMEGSLSYVPHSAEVVADGRANFTTYRTVVGGSPTEVSFYRAGPGNSEIALTYLSFATWTRTVTDGPNFTNVEKRYLPFGIATRHGLLSARTGTGSYVGVVHGSGAKRDGTVYEVGGTSRFAVDFSQARYSGALALTGKAAAGSADLGAHSFAGTINDGSLSRATFDGKLPGFNFIEPSFYGTSGQEIGAVFQLSTDAVSSTNNVNITGVALAKQQ